MIFVDIILNFAEGRTEGKSHFFQKNLAEGITEEGVVKMFDWSPGCKVTGTALRDEGMDVGIPLKVPAEGVEDADKTGSKVFGFVQIVEHTQYNIPDGGKEKT